MDRHITSFHPGPGHGRIAIEASFVEVRLQAQRLDTRGGPWNILTLPVDMFYAPRAFLAPDV